MLVHVNRLLGNLPNVRLIAPQGYRNFVALMARCRLVLTDSGGVQEEAPSLGKPVLVMRDTTERPEGVAAGTALLTGPNASAIVEHATRLLTDEAAYRSMANARESLWRRLRGRANRGAGSAATLRPRRTGSRKHHPLKQRAFSAHAVNTAIRSVTKEDWDEKGAFMERPSTERLAGTATRHASPGHQRPTTARG